MNREILFRGRSWAGIWVDGYLSVEFGKTYIRHEWLDDSSPSGPAMISVEVDPATVGQFTGLFDKNGNRIFEGDVVMYYTYTFHHPDEMRGYHTPKKYKGEGFTRIVCYENGLLLPFYDLDHTDGEFGDDIKYEYGITVKGNIHDNPEILNQ